MMTDVHITCAPHLGLTRTLRITPLGRRRHADGRGARECGRPCPRIQASSESCCQWAARPFDEARCCSGELRAAAGWAATRSARRRHHVRAAAAVRQSRRSPRAAMRAGLRGAALEAAVTLSGVLLGAEARRLPSRVGGRAACRRAARVETRGGGRGGCARMHRTRSADPDDSMILSAHVYRARRFWGSPHRVKSLP